MSRGGIPYGTELLRWYVCERKVAHDTVESAEAAIAAAILTQVGDGPPPEIYECPYAGTRAGTPQHWHYGRVGRHKSRSRLIADARNAWRYKQRRARVGDQASHLPG